MFKSNGTIKYFAKYMTKKSNTLILLGLKGLRRASAMKFRPYLTI